MIAVIQTVLDASVTVENKKVGQIDKGMLVYFSVQPDDNDKDLEIFLNKLIKLRIFKDENDKINLSLKDSNSSILFISQFTISANLYKGNRPSFDYAASAEKAKDFYFKAIHFLKNQGLIVECGEFGSNMYVNYTNDGPGTYILDSSKLNKN